MQFSKFIRIVWSINGILLLVFGIVLGVLLIKELIPRRYTTVNRDILVGNKLDEAKVQGLILQGLTYGVPERIYGTDGYILPIKAKTYDNPKRGKMAFDAASEYYIESESSLVNAIFLDMDFEVVNVLLSRKAFIHRIKYPVDRASYDEYDMYPADTLQKFITCSISFEDSNSDGVLNTHDAEDLYVAHTDGSNLTQVTNGVNVLTHDFISPSQILIKYTERTKEADEHKIEYFALYNIKTNELTRLTSLESKLNDIQELISK